MPSSRGCSQLHAWCPMLLLERCPQPDHREPIKYPLTTNSTIEYLCQKIVSEVRVLSHFSHAHFRCLRHFMTLRKKSSSIYSKVIYPKYYKIWNKSHTFIGQTRLDHLDSTKNFCNFPKVSYFWQKVFSFFHEQNNCKIRVCVYPRVRTKKVEEPKSDKTVNLTL